MPKFKITIEQKVTEHKEIIVEAPSREVLTEAFVFCDLEADHEDQIKEGSEVYSHAPAACDGYTTYGIELGNRYVEKIEQMSDDTPASTECGSAKHDEVWEHVLGRQLKNGDTIKTWWAPGRDTIVAIAEYSGSIKHVFNGGAKIAAFAIGPGMTIENSAMYQRLKI